MQLNIHLIKMNEILSFLKNRVLPQSVFLILVTFFRNNRRFGDIEKTLSNLKTTPQKSLDLGCGQSISNPFNAKELFGADIRELNSSNVYKCTLGIESLPFDDSFFDCMTAFDLIEHIPRVTYINGENHNPFIFLMDEVYRCLRPGGLFLSHTPAYPSPAAFQDPTHVNVITQDTFKYYFCDPTLYAKNYGFKGSFSIVKQGWNGHHLITLLKKN